jgi:SnoaL-like domain
MTKAKSFLIALLVLVGFGSLKAQTLTVNDKIELSELVSKWNLYTDTQNLANLDYYMNLWTANSPVLTNPFGTFKGLEAIKKWQQGYNVTGGPAFGKRHSSVNIVSQGKGKNVAEIDFDLYLSEVNEIPYLAATARNKVVALKENGVWKIQSYILVLDAGFTKAMEKAKK